MSTGNAGSRFVSETQLNEAQKKREEEIRASYARMGQDAPADALRAAAQQQDTYDPRSLFEKLQANKDAKQEAWEDKHKLANQFRGIDESESQFLAEVARERKLEQRRKELETQKELDDFRRAATAAHETSPPDPRALYGRASSPSSRLTTSSQSPPQQHGSSSAVAFPASSSNTVAASAAPSQAKAKGKRKREGLLGVVKKKPALAESAQTQNGKAPQTSGAKEAPTTASSEKPSTTAAPHSSEKLPVQRHNVKDTGADTRKGGKD